MVFLGGAVLANIVSAPTVLAAFSGMTTHASRWRTRKTCGYRSKSGRSRAHAHWRSLVRDEGRDHWLDLFKSAHGGKCNVLVMVGMPRMGKPAADHIHSFTIVPGAGGVDMHVLALSQPASRHDKDHVSGLNYLEATN